MSTEEETLWQIIIVEFVFLCLSFLPVHIVLHCFRPAVDTSFEKHVSAVNSLLYIGTK